MLRKISGHINELTKLATYSRYLGDLALKTSSRLDSMQALAHKTAADRLLCSTLDKLAFSVLDSIQSAKNSDVLKGILFGTGAAIPLAAAGKYVSDEASDRAEALGNKALAAAPVAILAGLAASRAMSGKDSSIGRDKTSEFLAAYSTRDSLINAEANIKTAADRQYTSRVLDRCNAHLADIIADALL